MNRSNALKKREASVVCNRLESDCKAQDVNRDKNHMIVFFRYPLFILSLGI